MMELCKRVIILCYFVMKILKMLATLAPAYYRHYIFQKIIKCERVHVIDLSAVEFFR